MDMGTHECQFLEEVTPEGVHLLAPCLLCGYTAADALAQLQLKSVLPEDEQRLKTLIQNAIAEAMASLEVEGGIQPDDARSLEASVAWGQDFLARMFRARLAGVRAAAAAAVTTVRTGAESTAAPSILVRVPCPQDEADHYGCATCEGIGFIYRVRYLAR